MKKLFCAIISAAALLSFLPMALAQESYIDNGNGIGYSKSIKGPDDNGVYTIYLQTFVMGSVTTVNESIPADIVLVLDVSGSMNDNITTYSYTARASQNYSYNSYGTNTYYYKHTDDNYYAVSRGGSNISGRYLRFSAAGTYYYLSNSAGGVTTTRPTDITNQNTTIWTGVLYERATVSSQPKIDALKTAVNAFIDEVHHNDLYDDNDEPRDTPLGNQISIVKFACDQYYGSESSITPGNHRGAGSDSGAHSPSSNYNYTEVLQGFTTTSTDAGVNELKSAVASIIAGGATAAHYGMKKAQYLLESLGPDHEDTFKTVLMFTDGIPGISGWDGTFANNAIANSYVLKNTHEAKVFTVGVFGNLGSDATNVHNYMNYTSSNYPEAQSMTNPGSGSDQGYYQDASEADLTAVFTSIAAQTGGAGIDLTTSTVATVDVITNSFALPAGATADDIQVFTAACTGESGGYLQFEPEAEWTPNPSAGEEGHCDIVIEEDNHTISVTGFPYSDEWCGPIIENGVITGYHGHKLIIEIPIVMASDAVGGPNVATNGEGTGIIVDGVNIAPFVTPHVSLPINLHIQKNNLEVGESAKYLILRKWDGGDEIPEGIDPNTWYPITTVFVTRRSTDNADPVVPIRGLDPDYIYKIVEEDWSWSYEFVQVIDKDGNVITSDINDVTSDKLITNPFIFVNNKKTDIDVKVRHAESKVKNNFIGDGSVTYDDSKYNGRETGDVVTYQ